MRLDSLFPDYEMLSSSIDRLPNEWNRLLAIGRGPAMAEVCECIGLERGSRTWQLLAAEREWGILVPKRKRSRNRVHMWRLALQISDELATYFTPISSTRCLGEYPRGLIALSELIGVCHFTQYGECLLTTEQIDAVSHEVNARMAFEDRREDVLTAFFDHGTGDYDCWRGADRLNVFYYDHETCDLSLFCSNGFAQWFDKRFMSCVET